MRAATASRLAWRELGNKLLAFRQFRRAAALRGKREPLQPLAAELARALAMPAFESFWAVEGLGYARAEAASRAGEDPGRLLAGGPSLPDRALIPLQAGMGLSHASRALAAFAAASSPAAADVTLTRFVAAARACSCAGCEGAALEALGFVARTLYPHLVPRLGRRLGELAPAELPAYFWHGLGRGLYFVPTNVLPWGSAAWRAVRKALSEAPDEVARDNALAGLGWAMTLVNFRHPEVLEGFWRRYAVRLPAGGAFAGGVATAVVVWAHAVGSERWLAAFLAHRPAPATAGLDERWEREVAEPCARALTCVLPRLAAERRLGELFRCQTRPAAGAGRTPLRAPFASRAGQAIDGLVGRLLHRLDGVGGTA